MCLDTYPPIFYMNDTSKAIIRLVHALNALNGSICAAYTFDAGPNAVIYTLEKFAPLGLLTILLRIFTTTTICSFVFSRLSLFNLTFTSTSYCI